MSFILKRIVDGKFLVEDTEHKRFWGYDIEDAVRFSSSTLAEREASFFPYMDNVKVIGFEGKLSLPPEFPNMNFDFYYSQASKHLRLADMKGAPGTSINERGLDSAIMHAEFAVAFLKMAKSNLQGELF